MSVKIKAGTCFVLPVRIDDKKFDDISAIEFLFKQTKTGDSVKTAYWQNGGTCRDVEHVDGTNEFVVLFSVDDSYLFKQNEMFFMDVRIHYLDAATNPFTPILRIRMSDTLYAQGEEVGP